MNPKTTIGLLAAVILAVGALWWAQSSAKLESQKPDAGPKALFDPAPEGVRVFEMVQASTGQSVKCEMGDDKNWRLTAPISGPAEQFVVTGDLSKVTELKYVKSFPPGDADRPTDDMTSLKTPQRIVKLTDQGGRVHVLKIGARQALSSNTYVQKEGDETIYLVNTDVNTDLKHGLAEYRGKRVAEFVQAEARRIDVTGEHQYTLSSVGGKWTIEAPVKARADASKVNALLSTISNLSAEKFVEDNAQSLRPYGLEPPRLTVTVSIEKRTPKEPPAPPASAPAEPEFEITTQQVRLALGGSADEKTFAKTADPDNRSVFVIPEATAKQVLVSLNDLRDRKVTDIGPARIQQIKITRGQETTELTNTNNVWQITAGLPGSEPRSAEFAAVDDLIKSLRELSAEGFENAESPAHGFADPRAVVDVTFEGTIEPLRLTFGAATPSGTGAFVRNDREGFVAVVKSEAPATFLASAASFMNRDLLRLDQANISRIDLAFTDWNSAVVKSDGAWRFAEPIEGPAEVSAVQAILTDLAFLRGRKVVALASDAAKYDFENPIVRATIVVQTPPPASQPTSDAADQLPPSPTTHALRVTRIDGVTYAMAEGSPTICEVDPKVLDDLKAELFDRKVVDIQPTQCGKLTVRGRSTSVFDKDGDTWTLVGEPTFSVDPAKVTALLTDLQALRAERYARYRGANLAEFGLDQPAVSISVASEQGQETTIMISDRGPTPSERYAATAQNAGRVFVIKAEDAAKFSKEVADFQKQG